MNVTFDERSIIVNGKRELLVCGSVHYPRSTPGMWRQILRESKRAGVNCIDTYVFWEGHEPEEGQYDFTGRYNLGHFLDLCREEGLYVILRIGPYICAEWNFGGLPWWLLTKPGLITRTWNEPFMQATERWVRILMQQIGDRQITRGGSVILAQMENEYGNLGGRYGDDGLRYLAWISEMGRNAGIEVPLIMCVGAASDAMETINGMIAWPLVQPLLRERPGQPALWTEFYPGWYSVWGDPRYTRTPEEMTYEVTRFIAAGGSGLTYFMWHGGTTFDRDTMYLMPPRYDFDNPLDEFGLPTDKSEHLALLHHFLLAWKDLLLEGERKGAEILHPGERGEEADSVVLYPITHQQHELVFCVNAMHELRTVSVRGVSFTLPARSTAVVEGKLGGEYAVTYRTWDTPEHNIVYTMQPVDLTLTWQMIEEPLPSNDAMRTFTPVTLPHNMVLETRDRSDFGWYRTVISFDTARTVTLSTRVADLLTVWNNGQYIDTAPERLRENRPSPDDFIVSMDVPLQIGRNELLCCVTAMGLIKHDVMIDAPQSEEKKGLIAPVCLDGVAVSAPWEFSPLTWGERVKLSDPEVATLAPWGKVDHAGNPLRWYRATFTLEQAHFDEDVPWALEIGSLQKGLIWVNGHGIGRYWQLPAMLPKDVPILPDMIGSIAIQGHGEPVQRHYHIPTDWLRPGLNTLMVLEEHGALPGDARLMRRTVAKIHNGR